MNVAFQGETPASPSLPRRHHQSPPRAAVLMVAAALFFAAMSAFVKGASATVPNAVVVFFRNAAALACLLPWVLRRGPAGLHTRHLPEHLVRGLFGLGAMYCFFHAIAHLRLADAVLLNYTLPLFVPPIERLWLGERLPRLLWWPILLGFIGILILLRPGPGVFQPMALFAVAAAFLAAVAQVGVRKLTAAEPAAKIVVYFALIGTIASAPAAILTWTSPVGWGWALVLGSGIAGTAGQLLMTRAYAAAPAAQAGPFLYTSVVFSGLMDFVIWDTRPDLLFVLGAAVVVAAAILTLRLKARQREPREEVLPPAVA